MEHEAFQHYRQMQQHVIDGHNVGLRDKSLDVRFMDHITKLLEGDATKAEVMAEIRRSLAAVGVQSNSAGDILKSSCSEMAIHAARLLTMAKIGPLKSEPKNPRKYVTWSAGTLRQCLDKYFNTKPTMKTEGFRLPKAFDAWTIEKLAGVRIKFTDNLADHLRLEEGDDQGEVEVFIFHHATFLKGQGQGSLLPQGLADETLKTLALLFPQRNYSKAGAAQKKRAWFERCCRNARKDADQVIDERIIKCGNLTASERQIDQFRYWRDRLVMLKQAYDETTPRGLPQWWYDRRNGVQWYTFWTAIVVLVLTVFFGLVQSVEGAIQVYKAYHPS